MADAAAILGLISALATPASLERRLTAFAEGLARMLGGARVSVRLLDETGHKLLVGARSGDPLHVTPIDFALGVGLIGWIAKEARPICVEDGEKDPRFASMAGMGGPMGAFLGAPLLDAGRCIGVLSAVRPKPFDEEESRTMELAAGMCAQHLQIARLQRLSSVDPLTGALNRRGLDEHWEHDAPEPLSVIMVDLDHFKHVNDRHGHAAGDEVLTAVSAVLAGLLRRVDAIVRLGGEEFLLVLPGADEAAAAAIAERARAAVAAMQMRARGVDEPLSITISLGVAERRPGEARDAVIARADTALYAAKEGGRNRVERAGV